MDKELLLKYIAGKASQKEKEDIATWIDADAANLKEFISLRKSYDAFIWQDTGVFSKKTKKTISLHPVTQRILRIAAVFVVAFGLSYAMIQVLQKEDIEMQTVYVPAGQRTLVTLADGTTVWVNGKSTLTFPSHFSSRTRTVELDGEAYFDVIHNEKQPFIVKTQQMDIQVLGTEFNVASYSNSSDFEVSLLRGSIELSSPNLPSNYRMKEKEHVQLKDNKLIIDQIADYDYFRWKEGLICFNNESVATIIEKLKLYYDIDIKIYNKRILNSRYSGKFRTKDGIEQVLKVLQIEHKFSYTKNSDLNLITIK